jgi:hypothetical protein
MFGKIDGREVRKIGGIAGRRKRGIEDWKKAGQEEDKYIKYGKLGGREGWKEEESEGWKTRRRQEKRKRRI